MGAEGGVGETGILSFPQVDFIDVISTIYYYRQRAKPLTVLAIENNQPIYFTLYLIKIQ